MQGIVEGKRVVVFNGKGNFNTVILATSLEIT